MGTRDRTADLTLLTTILAAILVLTVVQVGDMARRVRNGERADLLMRLILGAFVLIAFAAVAALAEVPAQLLGRRSWFTLSVAAWLVPLLLAFSIGAPILAAGVSIFSKRPERSASATNMDFAVDRELHPRRPMLIWTTVVLVLAVMRRWFGRRS